MFKTLLSLDNNFRRVEPLINNMNEKQWQKKKKSH